MNELFHISLDFVLSASNVKFLREYDSKVFVFDVNMKTFYHMNLSFINRT